jgi:hypothetical protein
MEAGIKFEFEWSASEAFACFDGATLVVAVLLLDRLNVVAALDRGDVDEPKLGIIGGVVENTVGKWRRRFVQDRVEGLRDEPRTGAPRTIDDARIEAVIVSALESLPKDATHWSSRGMAKQSGLSVSERARQTRLRKDGRSLGIGAGQQREPPHPPAPLRLTVAMGAEDEAVIETSHNQSTIRLWLKH